MKVMLVEDEALIAFLVEDALQELGCEVIGPFGAVAPALDWLASPGADPDAAVLDVNLGGEQVFPVAEALKARGVPFAFATGYGVVDDARFATEPVLAKPLDPDKLAAVVEWFKARAG